MSSKFWTELSNDYEKLFETEIGYDVIIYAGEEPNIREIHVQVFYVLGPNIFALHFLTNGLRRVMGNSFLKNQIFLLTYLISFSGKV